MNLKIAPMLLGFLWLYPGSSVADCMEQARVGNGDWKRDVLAADKVKQMLVTELTQSLMNIGECEEISEQASADTASKGGTTGGAAGGGGGSASGSNTSDSAIQLAEASNTTTPSEEQNQAHSPEFTGQKRSAASDDIAELEGPVLSDNGLEVVLREAIQTETDPVKRRALIGRYRQLFEGLEPPNEN